MSIYCYIKNIVVLLTLLNHCISASPLLSQSTLRLNELMARNNSTIADEQNEYNDWIEVYNDGETPVDLAGFFITDDAAIPDKWRIPPGNADQTTVPANGFALLWADGSPDEGPLHLSFKLDGDGEEIALYSPDGALVDFITFEEQRPDTSYGRNTETLQWQFYPVPTPGAENIEKFIIDPLHFSHDGGVYERDITVELTGPEGTDIYFTLDGSDPQTEGRHLYSRPIYLDNTTVVRAKCVKGDNAWSDIRTETFLIGEQFNLPVFSLTTDPTHLWGANGIYDNRFENWEKPVHVEYFEANERRLFIDAGIKIHGPGALDQQSLRLYARTRYGSDMFRYTFFNEINIHEFKRLVLRNGGNDCTNAGPRQTHLRDAIVHALYRQRNPEYAMSAYKPVHVFLNGAFWGIYNLRERQDEYFIQSHYGFENIDFLEYAAEEGEENEKRNAIAGDWTAFEALIHFAQNNDLTDKSNYDYVASQVDIANLCEYWIFQTAVANYDWPFHNNKFFRSRAPGHKWQWVLWDTEFSLGHIWHKSYTWECLARSLSTDPTDKHLEKYPWFAQHRIVPEIFKNAEFQKFFINRYYDCLNTTLSTENMLKTIDSLAAHIQPDIEQQLARWDGSADDWRDAVDDIRTFAQERPAIAEQHVRDYFGLPEAVNVTVNVLPAETGHVRINTITPSSYPWNGDYNPGVPVTVTATAKPGYVFTAWKEQPMENNETMELQVSARTTITALFSPEQTDVQLDKSQIFNFALKQNYPNPFNSETLIQYSLPTSGHVVLTVYSVTGQPIAVLVDQKQDAGVHQASWDATGLASGIYILRLKTEKQSTSRRMIVLQ